MSGLWFEVTEVVDSVVDVGSIEAAGVLVMWFAESRMVEAAMLEIEQRRAKAPGYENKEYAARHYAGMKATSSCVVDIRVGPTRGRE